jgi:hypothetical protein
MKKTDIFTLRKLSSPTSDLSNLGYKDSTRSLAWKNFKKVIIYNQTVIAATLDGSIVRIGIDFAGEAEEIELTRRGSDEIQQLFVIPNINESWQSSLENTISHTVSSQLTSNESRQYPLSSQLVSTLQTAPLSEPGNLAGEKNDFLIVASLRSGDNFSISGKTFKSRKISALLGQISSCCLHSTNSFDNVLLVGMNDGKLFELRFDLNWREKSCFMLYQFFNKPSIISICSFSFPRPDIAESYLILCSTIDPIQVYYFFGGPSLQKVFSEVVPNQNPNFAEFPGELISADSTISYGVVFDSYPIVKFNVVCRNGLYTGLIHMSKRITRYYSRTIYST